MATDAMASNDQRGDHSDLQGTMDGRRELLLNSSEYNGAPANIRTPDAQWLSEVLGIEVAIDQQTVIGESRGFLSTAWQLQLSTKPAGLAPASVVLKSQSANPLFLKLAAERRSFEREMAFYRDLAPLVEAQLPKVYAIGNANDPWLLMEDLSHRRAGDQVRGLSHHEARAVVRQIAKIHANFWQSPTLSTIDWLPSHRFWFSDIDESILDAFLNEYGRRIGDGMVTVLKAVLRQLPAIDQALSTRPITLVHGDLRADNLLFEGDEERPIATILDWQTACCSMGAIDIANLIGGSEPEAERYQHITELLYLWHGELVAHGVHDYTLDDARQDFKLGALRCLTAALRLYKTLHHESTTVRGAIFRDETIERSFHLAESIEAWTALPEPL